MAGEEQNNVWPMPRFFFQVDIADIGDGLAFQEVTGLDAQTEVIEYRSGNSKVFTPVKMPGMQKFGNVTLKKGVFAADNKLFDWFNESKLNTIMRRSVTIKLLNENAEPTMVFKLQNAFPIKIAGTDLNATANEVAIEELELAHEGLVIENG